ncbi:putative uncharacterized protein DDB_G0271606 isoform X1 [Drosophila grimshawi]|uniref:putative uncharacterized protein DDB_G0271606 isoform X1 n=1 Tax=Drosophila grimshawi TaxID=7222 RepID=UPI000C86FFC9|nr:putative uncharacterized protein DDB_G0271606 isoform X1 [Drosophila grimshawi]
MATSTMSATASPSPAAIKNPQLKRVVYSKYRELLGSYNDKANAIIETLPAYMVREDRGFQLEMPLNGMANGHVKSAVDTYGQRGGGAAGGGGYEAPACVQNAMMTKDKKPFTYTPGGIDLSQIRSERMAKRLARNAQAEGATGASQQNRPSPQSPGSGTGGSAASAMGAAAMGMPFQVLPPPPPPQPQSQTQGKNGNNAAAPPPPPPQQSTLAPPAGRGSAPGSPAAARKSPTPQRFEPPPLGFRPEIKIPANPMAALRKVPPPVEKNTFWKDEYVKDRSKSPLPEPAQNANGDYGNGSSNSNNNNISQDAVDAYRPSDNASSYNNGGYNNYSNGNGNNSYSPYTQQLQQQQQPQAPSPKSPPLQYQQQQLQQPTPPATPPQQQPQQQFRSVPMPQSPAVNVYTRQTDSPRSPFEVQQQQQQRATESPFRFAQQQQQQQQPRPPTAISPLAQQQEPRPPTAISPLAQQQQQPQQQQQAAQTVPWRTQRAQPAAQQLQQQQPTHPQPIFNNVQQQQQQQQQQQRSRDVFSPARTEPAAAVFNAQQQQNSQYQGAKPTNVGSLYIAPLAQPTEPQAQRLLLQQQQQAGARDSPMRQMPQQQQQPQQQQAGGQPLRWLSSQPASKEQAPWARPEENGNVVPSTLRQATPSAPAPVQSTTTAFYQPQMMAQGNGYATASSPAPAAVPQQNFGSNAQQSGLRLQINTNVNSSNANQSGPRERIIPITLEQTPTYAAAQPNFGAPAGHIIRSANQFVDQGYNNYPPAAAAATAAMSPNQQQHQQQFYANNNNNNNSTRIIPIAIEGGRGGHISQSPVVLQNDPRSPPIQSKSFRILQKITDTVDDGSSDARLQSPQQQQQPHLELETPQLQRPQFARQMSAQQARNSPTIEQMRRLQIAQDQSQSGTPPAWSPQGNGVSAQNRFTPQRSPYDTPQQQYIPASEQQALEPKKYTGSAIPSRSFKILQAMTTPENAGPGQSDL